MILNNSPLFSINLVLTNLASFTLLSFTGSVALAETPTDIYTAEYAQQYRQNCMTASTAEGLTEPDAEELCECTLTKFQQEYSLAEFKELNAKAKENQESANALVEVGQSCFESILFEE